MRIKLIIAHRFTSNWVWGQIYAGWENAEEKKKNLSDMHKHRRRDRDQFSTEQHIHRQHFSPPWLWTFVGSIRGHLGWITNLMMSAYPDPALALSPLPVLFLSAQQLPWARSCLSGMAMSPATFELCYAFAGRPMDPCSDSYGCWHYSTLKQRDTSDGMKALLSTEGVRKSEL